MICNKFKLSNFHNTLNPLNLNYLLIQHQAFDELSECFHKHVTNLIDNYDELKSNYPLFEELTKDDRDQLVEDIGYIREKNTSIIRKFIENYINDAREIFPEIFGNYHLDAELDSGHLKTVFLQLLDDYLQDDLEHPSPSHFLINYKYIRKIENSGHLLLTPVFNLFYDYIHNTYHIEQIEDYLKEILVTDDPLSLDETFNRLNKYGLSISEDFFIHYLINNPNFLIVDQDKVEIVEEVFPSYRFLSVSIKPINYIKIDNYHLRDSEFEAMDFDVNEDFLIKYFQKFQETKFLNSISYEELGIKLRIFRRLEHRQIQDIQEDIHIKIVNLLKDKAVALTHQQICNYLQCEDIPLRVSKLPMGRILAYGSKTLRFLNKDTASYILSDWVKSNEQDRRKIHPSRVLTPLKYRKIIVDERVIQEIINKDECYKATKVIDLLEVYNQYIIEELKTHELEYYYEYQTLNIIKSILDEIYIYLGNDLYIDTNDIDLEFNTSTLRVYRKETVSYLTHNSIDQRNYLKNQYPNHFKSLVRLLS